MKKLNQYWLFPLALFSLIFLSSEGLSQTGGVTTKSQLAGQRNVVTTAVPFLTISPDSRAAGMGDGGVASSPDANSIHWNPGKLAFLDKKGGLSLSAAPWLRQLVPDVWFYYLSGYGKVGKRERSTLAGSLRYFSLGNIQFTDDFGNPNGNFEPKELAMDGSYASQLSDRLALGIALRFIYSNLAGNQTFQNTETRPGIAGAGDIGAYWRDKAKIGGREWDYALGGTISNIGSKITYTNQANRDFIPTNLRLGTNWKTDIDDHNQISFQVEAGKLLVPTPDTSIDKDKNSIPDYREKTVLQGVFSSFNDAPGGSQEELREIIYTAGIEYWYDKQFALRAGYFHEGATKGGREYLTFGIGLRYNVFGIDVAYLQPFAQRHPLQNTVRFSLLFDLDAFRGQ